MMPGGRVVAALVLAGAGLVATVAIAMHGTLAPLLLVVLVAAVAALIAAAMLAWRHDAAAVDEATLQAQRRLYELVEHVDQVMFLYDARERRMQYISPAYDRVWGRSCAELMARPGSWFEAMHPDDRATQIDRMGSRDVDVPHGLISEFRIVRADTGEVRWIRNRAFQIRDADGNILKLGGVAEDITERRALGEQVRQAQKMESLGQLAGGIAHDFNNVLAAISANVDMIGNELPKTDLARELVADVELSIARAADLTRQLLAFSRKQVAEPIVLDVNRSVSDALRILRRMLGEQIEIRTSLDPTLPLVRCDPSHLVQVLMNLTLNARDAMDGAGVVHIETRAGRGEAILAISDNGCGMTEDVRARVFEPFFTTKGGDKGTGLGLSVVHGIVQQAGGQVTVESVVGKGSHFTVRLPASSALATTEMPELDGPIDGAESILLVDDDAHVRSSTARFLRARGYTVHEAADAQSALGTIQFRPVDVLVTDVRMPVMDGATLAAMVRKIRPQLPVLFISGYTADETVRAARDDIDFLPKPFRLHELARRMRRLLERAAPDVDARRA